MAGIIGTGKEHLTQGLEGGSRVSTLEQQRNKANDDIKAANRQQSMSMTASGAAVGAYVGGPVGAVVGAGVGYLLGEVF